MADAKREETGKGNVPAAPGEAYQGPRRRSKDLPERPGQYEKGAVRLKVVHFIVITLSVVASLLLFTGIQQKQTFVEQLAGLDAAELQELRRMMTQQQLLTLVLLLAVAIEIAAMVLLVIRPVENYSRSIRKQKLLSPQGSAELRYFARAYNVVFEERERRNEELRYKVEHDALTGLYNRGAYEKLLEKHGREEDIALLWIDVDRFKGINDTYGHDIGDRVLQKVARLLSSGFRATDYACRTGGDEFAVIMSDIVPGQQQVVLDRIGAVRQGLGDVSDGLPPVTLSIGVAFSRQRLEGENLFKMADKALYRVKEAGRNGCAFFSEEDRQRET